MANKYGFSPVAPTNKNKYGFEPITETENPSFDPLNEALRNISGIGAVEKMGGAPGVIAGDIGSLLASMPKHIAEGIMGLPKDIDYLKEQIPLLPGLLQQPGGVSKPALAGLGEFAGKVSRITPAVVDYLAHTGLIKPETAKTFPRPFSEEEVKNYMDKYMGKELPGQGLIRGAFRNPENIYAGGKASEFLNPLRYTSKNIAKNVVKEEAKQIGIHNKAYNSLWDEAAKTGFNEVPTNIIKLSNDFQVIKKYKTPKEYQSLLDFANNRTLENAQKAQSDMGIIARNLYEKSKQGALTSEENATYNAAKSIEKHIEDNMFKNSKGEINKKLQKQYKKVTNSYYENVVPYKYNPDIQEYKSRKMLPEDLVKKLKHGEFAVKKGSKHPEIGRQDIMKNLLKGVTGITALEAMGIKIPLIDKLLHKD